MENIMVTEVYIKDNKNTPVTYLSKLDNFKNGTKYEFKECVNVIVGENGCGKTTLLNLICAYLLIDDKNSEQYKARCSQCDKWGCPHRNLKTDECDLEKYEKYITNKIK